LSLPIVQSTGNAGNIGIIASSPSLRSDSLIVNSIEVGKQKVFMAEGEGFESPICTDSKQLIENIRR
jgi:hypothetical protein